jgi:hypothetical protein
MASLKIIFYYIYLYFFLLLVNCTIVGHINDSVKICDESLNLKVLTYLFLLFTTTVNYWQIFVYQEKFITN